MFVFKFSKLYIDDNFTKTTTMKRKLEPKLKTDLINSSLWKNELLNDCKFQKVFLAIRDNKVGFYHKGGLLFCFDKNGYKTHLKYAAVIQSNGKDYLTEAELTGHKLSSDFESNYSRIKENCSKYSGVEDLGVSEIYHKNSYLSDNDIVVLDIEVSFQSFDEEKNQDRIDILLFNKVTQTLNFVESKHYSNKEIWSTTTPKVISQINRYENQIKQRTPEILAEYVGYINTINDLFGITLPEPLKIEPKVTLLIFGFDRDQLKGRMSELIIKKDEFKEIKVYKIGDVSKISTKTLWNAK